MAWIGTTTLSRRSSVNTYSIQALSSAPGRLLPSMESPLHGFQAAMSDLNLSILAPFRWLSCDEPLPPASEIDRAINNLTLFICNAIVKVIGASSGDNTGVVRPNLPYIELCRLNLQTCRSTL